MEREREGGRKKRRRIKSWWWNRGGKCQRQLVWMSGLCHTHTHKQTHTQTYAFFCLLIHYNSIPWAGGASVVAMATGSGQRRCVYFCASVCVSCMWAHAVMSSCGGERPRDADERGQCITRTDVLTAQFPWEQAPPPSSTLSSPTSTANISLLLPSLLIALAKAWQAPLIRLAASLCVSMHSW